MQLFDQHYCRGRLALEDGSIWQGYSFGAQQTRVGQVVFNTSLTGYQEILTDPSYCGQIVVMTAPQIGNTGVTQEDDESTRAFLEGFIVREISPTVSNWRAEQDLPGWLKMQEVPAICGIDTRALTNRLREKGSLNGVLTSDESLTDETIVAQARAWEGLDGLDLVSQVTCVQSYEWQEPLAGEWADYFLTRGEISSAPLTIAAFDFGIKHNILRSFAGLNCKVTVVPASTSADEVLSLEPDGVFLSNGPGDPEAVTYAISTVRELIGKVPLFGICLGHQILGLALGGKTYRLAFGHHGGNQPVKHLPSGRIEISAHNHNFAVDPESLPAKVEVTHLNLNDGCCEGFRHTEIPLMGIQYHPEAAPGPHDATPIFKEFYDIMLTEKQARLEGVR
ncbi:MAG: glutamine-hydrolyzing carbamoyl-phosphate synthase small subunit [Anaerolineales bacterium]|nr:glutamine-hydrolyzing carbamoyl-phosphate synthase small subunit [Anaerolineales bacterium]